MPRFPKKEADIVALAERLYVGLQAVSTTADRMDFLSNREFIFCFLALYRQDISS